jgi:hypothetical protein
MEIRFLEKVAQVLPGPTKDIWVGELDAEVKVL